MEGVMTCAQSFFGWLLQTTLVASLVICLILLIQKILGGRLGPRWCHALWLVLLIRMILPWSPSSRLSVSNLIHSLDSEIQSRQQLPPVEQEAVSAAEQTAETFDSTAGPELESDSAALEPVAPKPPVTVDGGGESKLHLAAIRQVLPVLWLAGAIVIGIYLLVSDLALWRIVKRDSPLVNQPMLELFEECKAQMGVQSLVVVVPSDQVRSPGLFGFVRPRLLLPRQMLDNATTEEIRYVFLHELAHLRRRDIYLGWLTSLLQVLHWFNPLVWLAFYRMRADRELACDALVLTRTGQDKSQEYGSAIVDLVRRYSRSRPLPAMAGIIESKSQLKRRIAMITEFKSNSYRWSPLAIILMVILACICLPDAEHTSASEAAASQPANQPKFTKIRIPNRIPWDAQLSPDGKNIAFVNEKRIWIMPRSSRLGPGYPGVPRPLDTAGVEADWCGLTWSADGRWIAFNGKEVKKGYQRIYIVSSNGGEPRQVYENNRDVRVVNYRMSLSPHGKTLAFTSVDANQLHIYSLPVDGGQPKKLVDARAREPVFSPDGKMIAYVEDKALGRAGGGLWVVPVAGGTPTLVAETKNASTPVWSPDGTRLALVDYESPKQILIVGVEKDGNPSDQNTIVDCPKGFDEIRRLTGWTPANEIGAIFQKQMEFALYKQPLHGGKATFITHGRTPTQPRWSPDGKQIFHVNKASSNWRRLAIGYVSADGGDVTTVPIQSDVKIRLWGYGTGNHISPDGKRIVFAGQKPPEGPHTMHIWTIHIDGGEPKQLTDAPAVFRDWYPCWSPDGKYIAFVRMKTPETWAVVGGANIYVVSADGGEPRQITSESDRVFCAGPVLWSPDGKLLSYFSRDKDDAGIGTIKVISPDGGEPRAVTKVEKIYANKEMAWSPDSKRIAYNARENKIKIVTIDDGSIEEIQPDLKDVDIYHLDWSPDGENLVFVGYTGGGAEFWMMENFLTEEASSVTKSESMTTVRRVGYKWRGPFANLSPDGRYMSDRDWNTGDLLVIDLATGESRTLAGTGSEEAGYPLVSAISPDSKEVAYLWCDHNTKASSLHVIALDGSGDKVLHEGNYPMPRAWSADGQKILVTVLGNDVAQMVWISRSDGSIQHIVDVNLGYLGKVDVSPDGRFIAYDRPQNEDHSKRDIFVFDLHENRELTIVNHPADDKLLGWTPDGRHMFFASDRTGTWDAWLQSMADGKPEGFPKLARHGIGNITPIGFTPYGSYYFGHEQTLEDVFIARLDLNTGDVLSEPVPVRQTGATDCHDWSPDGQYMAYCERRPDKSQIIHIRTLATGRERTLSDNLPYIRWLRWSPDSRSLLIDGYKRGDSRGAIFKIDARTGERTDLVRSDTDVLIRPEMSPDGRTLFYIRGNDPRSETVHLMARDLEIGREKELLRIDAPARLTGSALSPDGRQFILSIIPDPARFLSPVLKVLSTAGGEPRELIQFDQTEGLRAVGVTWMPDNQNVIFWKWFQGFKDLELWRIPAEGGEPRRLWSRNALGHMRIHPDGQRVAFYDRSTTRGVWVMENFLPEQMGK